MSREEYAVLLRVIESSRSEEKSATVLSETLV